MKLAPFSEGDRVLILGGNCFRDDREVHGTVSKANMVVQLVILDCDDDDDDTAAKRIHKKNLRLMNGAATVPSSILKVSNGTRHLSKTPSARARNKNNNNNNKKKRRSVATTTTRTLRESNKTEVDFNIASTAKSRGTASSEVAKTLSPSTNKENLDSRELLESTNKKQRLSASPRQESSKTPSARSRNKNNSKKKRRSVATTTTRTLRQSNQTEEAFNIAATAKAKETASSQAAKTSSPSTNKENLDSRELLEPTNKKQRLSVSPRQGKPGTESDVGFPSREHLDKPDYLAIARDVESMKIVHVTGFPSDGTILGMGHRVERAMKEQGFGEHTCVGVRYGGARKRLEQQQQRAPYAIMNFVQPSDALKALDRGQVLVEKMKCSILPGESSILHRD